MLANVLTVEDEEAVQTELKELQQEAVRRFCFLHLASLICKSMQVAEDDVEPRLELPSVPTAEPVSAIPDGECSAVSLLQPCFDMFSAHHRATSKERVPVAA